MTDVSKEPRHQTMPGDWPADAGRLIAEKAIPIGDAKPMPVTHSHAIALAVAWQAVAVMRDKHELEVMAHTDQGASVWNNLCRLLDPIAVWFPAEPESRP